MRDRREKYHLRPGRADVIVPAAEIYLRIMTLAGSSHMLVPKVGLVDGMVLDTHDEWKQEQLTRQAKKRPKKKEGQ